MSRTTLSEEFVKNLLSGITKIKLKPTKHKGRYQAKLTRISLRVNTTSNKLTITFGTEDEELSYLEVDGILDNLMKGATLDILTAYSMPVTVE